MRHDQYPEYAHKVHLHHDQSAYRHGPNKDRRYADTLCKYNGVAKFTTRDHGEVTCKTCLKKMERMRVAGEIQQTRYRTLKRWLRKPVLVLQVAYQKPYNFDPQYDIRPGGYTTAWRDVRPEEMINGEVKC